MRRLVPLLVVSLAVVLPVGRGAVARASSIAAGPSDFNGDGVSDLAIGAPGEAVTVAGIPYGYAGVVHVVYGSSTGLAKSGYQRLTQGFGSQGAVANGEDFGQSLAAGDFNGDGYADLAVGSPGEQFTTGAVSVLYGSSSGLSPTGDGLFTEINPNSDTSFGATLAAGDFNADGYADLAVGAPNEDIGTHTDAGAVEVLLGSASGITTTGATLWRQGLNGVKDTPVTQERFGSSLAAGDMGKGPQDDLAIGVPGQKVGKAANAGAVAVLYGSASGITSTGNQLWTQNSRGVPDRSEDGDLFGSAVAVGDLGKGPAADLAAGAPGDDIGVTGSDGTLNVIFGSSTGLRGKGAKVFSEATPGIQGGAQSGDQFGSSLAIANFGRGGGNDLAVGVPGKIVAGGISAGSVVVIYSGTTGLHASGSQFWTQNSPNVKEKSEYGDRFGTTLAAANFGNGAFADLAVGASGESIGSAVSAGVVNVLYGARKGLRSAGNQLWREGANLATPPGNGEGLGAALAAA